MFLAARSLASRAVIMLLLLCVVGMAGLAVFSAFRAVVEGTPFVWDEVILFSVGAEVAGMMLRDWLTS